MGTLRHGASPKAQGRAGRRTRVKGPTRWANLPSPAPRTHLCLGGGFWAGGEMLMLCLWVPSVVLAGPACNSPPSCPLAGSRSRLACSVHPIGLSHPPAHPPAPPPAAEPHGSARREPGPGHRCGGGSGPGRWGPKAGEEGAPRPHGTLQAKARVGVRHGYPDVPGGTGDSARAAGTGHGQAGLPGGPARPGGCDEGRGKQLRGGCPGPGVSPEARLRVTFPSCLLSVARPWSHPLCQPPTVPGSQWSSGAEGSAGI